MINFAELKLLVVSNTFLYLMTKEDRYRDMAKKAIEDLAKAHHVTLKKVMSNKLDVALKQFIQNKSGYNKTLRQLYFSI